MTGSCGYIRSQSFGTEVPQLRQRQALRSTCSKRKARKGERQHVVAAAAAVPVASTSAPASSLLSAAVEKLFNFPPVYAAAVKQVSFLTSHVVSHMVCTVPACLWFLGTSMPEVSRCQHACNLQL